METTKIKKFLYKFIPILLLVIVFISRANIIFGEELPQGIPNPEDVEYYNNNMSYSLRQSISTGTWYLNLYPTDLIINNPTYYVGGSNPEMFLVELDNTQGINLYQYTCQTNDTEWTFSSNGTTHYLWNYTYNLYSNHDIFNEDGTIFFSGVAPMPTTISVLETLNTRLIYITILQVILVAMGILVFLIALSMGLRAFLRMLRTS